MAKVSWNKFIEKHKKSGLAIHLQWSGFDPGGTLLPNGKMAPAALALLNQALAKTLANDWAVKSQTIRVKRVPRIRRPKGVRPPPPPPPLKVATVLLESDADAKAIRKMMGMTALHFQPTTDFPCRAHAIVPYEASRYEEWMKVFGYLA